jgi:hypothetical protein
MTYCFERRRVTQKAALICLAAGIGVLLPAQGSTLDTTGVTLLRAATTNLDGAGVRVAQVEGAVNTNQPPPFEVNPAITGQPTSLFTYYSSLGASSTYPNTVGADSWHADQVGAYFFGMSGGVATNVLHVDNFEESLFYHSIVVAGSTNINDPVVNQSFIYYPVTVFEQEAIDRDYDDYAARYDVLFVSGAGNGGSVPVSPPSTCYNGISVGAYINSVNFSSVGPTLDNGRAKPDITAPEFVTSYSTPQVAGAAAILIQAGWRGDGGGATNDAADSRTVKALLLNGAIKPPDWTNAAASPLDARYGAGVLNVFNSYGQLIGGKNSNIVSTTPSVGAAHPPTGATGTVAVLSGWDYTAISSSNAFDRVNHYYFNVTNGPDHPWFTATATLVWNRQLGKTDINDLDLFLYDAISSNLVASSTSLVDNVEHVFVPQLPPGRYDLQVLKNGGFGTTGKKITTTETYALAFEFFCPTLQIAESHTNVVVTWPVYPAGFALESAADLTANAWIPYATAPVVTNNLNQVVVGAGGAGQFFRLRRP